MITSGFPGVGGLWVEVARGMGGCVYTCLRREGRGWDLVDRKGFSSHDDDERTESCF